MTRCALPKHGLQWYPEEQLESGQLAYEAYHRKKTILDGSSWTWWEKLSEDEKDCWREAAHEVFRRGWISAAKPPHRH
jgi:hypothetical protein